MAMLTSCQSGHERQVQMLDRLMEATDHYDVTPNDSDARAVLYYMERHGTPRELQQAWRMMAKMYRRHGALMYEGFAYEMAADCVDSLSADFDPRALAEICYEWSINQQFSFDDELAKQTARRGMRLAQQAGDTLLYYRCMGQEANVALTVNADVQFLPTAYRAFSELWQRGRKDWAVDAFVPYISYLLNCDRKNLEALISCAGGTEAFFNGRKDVGPFFDMYDANLTDSMTMWMQRYERFTREDLEHVGSYAAIEYWKLRGDYHLHMGDFDSAHYYYMKLDHPWNYVRFYGYRRLFVSGLLLLLGLVGFAAYNLYRLRREHRETLEQNRAYADMLHSLRSQMKRGMLDTDIARRFHDLSAQDTHPTTEDWQALRDEIDRQYPQLFTTLQQQYAEHQPDQTLTEQERHVVGLIVIKCSPLQMSVLLVTSKSNVSNLRRLYNKLTGKDGSGTDLDKHVATLCE